MPHHHKVLLIFIISLVISAVAAYLLLDVEWFRSLMPAAIGKAAGEFSVFALFFIFTFDLLVVMIEKVQPETGGF